MFGINCRISVKSMESRSRIPSVIRTGWIFPSLFFREANRELPEGGWDVAKIVLALLGVLLAAGAQDVFGADDSSPFELIDRALKMMSRGDATEALSLYQRALEQCRSASDPRWCEALALDGMGSAYSVAGDKKKALEVYQRALLIQRAIGDRLGEAGSLFGI